MVNILNKCPPKKNEKYVRKSANLRASGLRGGPWSLDRRINLCLPFKAIFGPTFMLVCVKLLALLSILLHCTIRLSALSAPIRPLCGHVESVCRNAGSPMSNGPICPTMVQILSSPLQRGRACSITTTEKC